MSTVKQRVETEPNPLARALAELPEVWQSLLLEHEPDAAGRCRTCRSSGTPGVLWPCTLRVAAEDAREISRHTVVPPAPRGSS